MPDGLNRVPPDRQCGAKTRAGTPCKKWALSGRTRCRLHGGASLKGIASPRLTHGWYSEDAMFRIKRQMVEAHERKQAAIAHYLASHGYPRDGDDGIEVQLRDACTKHGVDLDTP